MSEDVNTGAAPSPQIDPVKAAAVKATPVVPDTTGKLLLTPEELDGKIQSALAAAQKKADDKAKKDREAAEAEEAKKRGEFEKVAQQEKERADTAEGEARKLRQTIALQSYLVEKHADYVGCSKYIAPLIAEDAEGDELTTAVKEATEQYVKDNPRQEKKAGTPAPLPRTGNRPTGGTFAPHPAPQNNERPARRFSTLTRRV